jgi:hypothetical protein
VLAGIIEIAEHIEQSKVGVAIAESRYWWPIFEGTHLLSLSVSFGLILLTDLRLVGVFLRQVPVTDVLHQLRPYVLTGFALTFVSGALLFWSEAAKIIASPLWTVKCVLIALGGLNALYFEFVIARRPDVVENRAPLPSSARYAGFASISIWVVVIICGRLLAYLPG